MVHKVYLVYFDLHKSRTFFSIQFLHESAKPKRQGNFFVTDFSGVNIESNEMERGVSEILLQYTECPEKRYLF